MGRLRKTPKRKADEKIIDWSEYLQNQNITRPLHPRPEMLTKQGYLDRKTVRYHGVVSIRYDARYVAYWLNKCVLQKLGIDKSELMRIVSNTFQGGFSYMANELLKPFNTSIPGLGKATFPELFQFLTEDAKKGRFWMILDNLADRILFLTDNAEPGRLVVPKSQYIGMNRLKGWRDSMDDYDRLQHLLTTEGKAESFEFDYYRKDSSLVRFQKSSYLIDGLWGTQCRASVSEGWEILRPAPTWDDGFPSDVVERKS